MSVEQKGTEDIQRPWSIGQITLLHSITKLCKTEMFLKMETYIDWFANLSSNYVSFTFYYFRNFQVGNGWSRYSKQLQTHKREKALNEILETSDKTGNGKILFADFVETMANHDIAIDEEEFQVRNCLHDNILKKQGKTIHCST